MSFYGVLLKFYWVSKCVYCLFLGFDWVFGLLVSSAKMHKAVSAHFFVRQLKPTVLFESTR